MPEEEEKRSNFKEEIFNYLKILRKLNDQKLENIILSIAAKEKALAAEKEKYQKEPFSLKTDIWNLEKKKKVLMDMDYSLSQRKEFLKEEKKLFHYLANFCYEWIFFNVRKEKITALTKDIYLSHQEETRDVLKTYLFDFGKFEIDLQLSNVWIDEDSAFKNVMIKTIGKPEKWIEAEKELKIYMSYAHPHINQTGQPCLGGFKQFLAEGYNKSRYLDVLLLIQKAFLPSFYPRSCFPSGCSGDGKNDWQKLFSHKSFLVKEENL